MMAMAFGYPGTYRGLFAYLPLVAWLVSACDDGVERGTPNVVQEEKSAGSGGVSF